MSKFITPLILIALAVGIYFTFTAKEVEKAEAIQLVNKEYETAIDNADSLIDIRDELNKKFSAIEPRDLGRLKKMLPDNVDNVRLIIDINDVANKNGFSLRNVRTSATGESSDRPNVGGQNTPPVGTDKYNVVTMSFSVTGRYEDFLKFLRELERSLRIIDITKITLNTSNTGVYEYGVELKTYWLKI